MSEVNTDSVVAALGNMSVMDLITLTKDLEQKWGVEAKPQPFDATAIPSQQVQESSQTEFDVIFVSYAPDKKIALVKLVRELLGLGLVDSKNLVESVPKTLKEGATKEEAEAMKAKLTEAGAVIEIK